MRQLLIPFLCLGLGALAPRTATAGRPSVTREAQRVGLVGKPTSVHGAGPRTRRRVWTGPAGTRWEIREVSKTGRLIHHTEGLDLANGRYLFIARDLVGRSTIVDSRWRARGTRFEHLRIPQAYGWRRYSGSKALPRLTGTGIPTGPDAPLRYIGGSLRDIESTLEHMTTMATRLGRDVEVDINAVWVIAHPNETAAIVRDRAKAMGARGD